MTAAQIAALRMLAAAGSAERCDARRWAVWLALAPAVRSGLLRARPPLVERSIARGVTLTSRAAFAVEVARAQHRRRRN